MQYALKQNWAALPGAERARLVAVRIDRETSDESRAVERALRADRAERRRRAAVRARFIAYRATRAA